MVKITKFETAMKEIDPALNGFYLEVNYWEKFDKFMY